jgi:hypothetical protein
MSQVIQMQNYFVTDADNTEAKNKWLVAAGNVFNRALNSSFDNKKELSDWVNSILDSDDFEIEADVFIDDTNDIINIVAEHHGLE